jgi:hypothetical protein
VLLGDAALAEVTALDPEPGVGLEGTRGGVGFDPFHRDRAFPAGTPVFRIGVDPQAGAEQSVDPGGERNRGQGPERVRQAAGPGGIPGDRGVHFVIGGDLRPAGGEPRGIGRLVQRVGGEKIGVGRDLALAVVGANRPGADQGGAADANRLAVQGAVGGGGLAAVEGVHQGGGGVTHRVEPQDERSVVEAAFGRERGWGKPAEVPRTRVRGPGSGPVEVRRRRTIATGHLEPGVEQEIVVVGSKVEPEQGEHVGSRAERGGGDFEGRELQRLGVRVLRGGADRAGEGFGRVRTGDGLAVEPGDEAVIEADPK